MCKLPRKAYRDYFPNYMGLLQSEVLSPILFPMYINNIEFNFIKENGSCVDIQLNNIFLLIYAEWYGFNSRIATKFTKKGWIHCMIIVMSGNRSQCAEN